MDMDTITRTELNSTLKVFGARIYASIDNLRDTLESFVVRAEEHDKARDAKLDLRDKVLDAKFAHMDERWRLTNLRVDEIASEMRDVKRTLSNQRYWIVGTAIGAVLGVGAFNATVLSNMIAAFESGKSISAAQAEIIQRSREMEQAIDHMRSRLEALPLPMPVSNPPNQSPPPSSRPQSASRRRRPWARR
ncbi:hypothetical protein [Pararobbsia alpina]|uniref:Uncharacterized protein n=1 Tax=Pararobbsia alpina TaxID=621374 RepID=A0A6S7BC95_9BURK|nr:hypothetical protein [Pararobbsia alpina]CAB3794588.1 hypothetical protein LMG28138_03742 [Pararobbsia alpina]